MRRLGEDVTLKVAQGGRRLETEVVGETLSEALVEPEGVDLASAAREGPHELRVGPLTERMGGDDALQHAHGVSAAPHREQRFDAILYRRLSELLEASRLGSGDVVVSELGERWAPPQFQGVIEHLERSGWVHVQGRSCLIQQLAELQGVELVRAQLDRIPRGAA